MPARVRREEVQKWGEWCMIRARDATIDKVLDAVRMWGIMVTLLNMT
jgi:hypothetical protein